MAKKQILHSGHIRAMALIAMLSALAFVLQLWGIKFPFMPGFLTFDFSELPSLIASFGIGPWAGVLVCLVKNLLHLTMSSTGGVGELSNFLLGAVLSLTAGYIYRIRHTRIAALLGSLLGSLLMGLASIPSNYFIMFPLFGVEAVLGMYQAILPLENIWLCLLVFNLPFTFVKGALSAVLAFIVYKYIAPLLEKAYRKGRERMKKKKAAKSGRHSDTE